MSSLLLDTEQLRRATLSRCGVRWASARVRNDHVVDVGNGSGRFRPTARFAICWCGGTLTMLKRGYGWGRSRIDGTEGARIWSGHGVLAHNVVKISALAA